MTDSTESAIRHSQNFPHILELGKMVVYHCESCDKKTTSTNDADNHELSNVGHFMKPVVSRD